MTHLNGHITKTTLTALTVLLLFTGCRKFDRDFTEPITQPKPYEELKKQFFNTSTADPEVQKVAADIKKQDSIFKFLPDFVKNNGIPKWDKTLYKVQNINNTRPANSANSRTSSSEGSQGVFFIPLQSQTDGKVQSYITAYKHGDSTYTYKLFNKDSLSRNNPGADSIKKAVINSLGVLAYFEKTINNQPASQYKLSANETVEFKNPSITIGAPLSGRSRYSGSSARTSDDCFFNLTVTETYTEINVYVNGQLVYHYESYSVSVVLTIWGDCGGGGGSNTGSGGWYNWGTGYNGDPYWYNYNYGWLYPWWTSGGGGGNNNPPSLTYDPNQIKLDTSFENNAKAKCVYDKLMAESKFFKDITQGVFGGNTNLLEWKVGVTPPTDWGITSGAGGLKYTITINENFLSNASLLSVATTLVHEAIHARMFFVLEQAGYLTFDTSGNAILSTNGQSVNLNSLNEAERLAALALWYNQAVSVNPYYSGTEWTHHLFNSANFNTQSYRQYIKSTLQTLFDLDNEPALLKNALQSALGSDWKEKTFEYLSWAGLEKTVDFDVAVMNGDIDASLFASVLSLLNLFGKKSC